MPQATSLLSAPPKRAIPMPLPGAEPNDLVIRVRKRGPLPDELQQPRDQHWRESQVWDADGCWAIGLYPTRKAARAAAKLFLEDPAAFPNAVRHKGRCRGHESRYKWVRWIPKGVNTWQARPWLGEGRGSLNLGLFTFGDHGDNAEWTAAQVAKAFMRLWVPGRTVAEAVALLKADPKVRKWVRADIKVPKSQCALLPPRNFGPTEEPEERVERLRLSCARNAKRREHERYKDGLLFAA